MLKPNKYVNSNLITIEQASSQFYKLGYDKQYKNTLTYFTPNIGKHFYGVKFNLNKASKIARFYCKLRTIKDKPLLTWYKKSWDIIDGLKMPWEVPARTYTRPQNGWRWTIFNPARWTGRNSYFMWECFAHELAHYKQANHNRDGFGVEIMIVQDFFKKYGKELVK